MLKNYVRFIDADDSMLYSDICTLDVYLDDYIIDKMSNKKEIIIRCYGVVNEYETALEKWESELDFYSTPYKGIWKYLYNKDKFIVFVRFEIYYYNNSNFSIDKDPTNIEELNEIFKLLIKVNPEFEYECDLIIKYYKDSLFTDIYTSRSTLRYELTINYIIPVECYLNLKKELKYLI